MMILRKIGHLPALEALVILIIAGVTYLPNLRQATIYRDDWYYVMDRMIGGPGVYQEMFRIDRPARGPLFEAYYQLFGIQPFPYHMSSFFWRVASGLAALWLFRQLWPRQRLANFMMALLFVLYPGYLRWMEGFENQPRILSSVLEALSIAMTLQAIGTRTTILKILLWTGSILTGWAYLALVDFAFGMEVFRFLCIYIRVDQDQEQRPFIQKLISTIRAWGVAAAIPLGFLFWRFFIFHNERPATDIGLQLSSFITSPVSTGVQWLLRLFQSTFNVTVSAWSAPPFQDLFEIPLPKSIIGILTAGIAVGLFLWVSLLISNREEKGRNFTAISHGKWQTQAIQIGLLGIIAGVLPVIVANRFVNFAGYSHYALPASLASATMAVGLISLMHSRSVRFSITALIVFLAVLTHYTVSLRILHEEQVIAGFWQQVAWRAPGIKAGTTLFVSYPSVQYGEDIDAVAGPANFIYFPGQTNQIPVLYALVALPQMPYTTVNVLRGGRERVDGYRTHVGEIDYENMLVISQPAEDSCVHVIVSQWPRYSNQDSDQIRLLGQYSNVQNVLTGGRSPRPAEIIFGPEPDHTWCYYYQQAELALQQGDWEEVIRIGKRANELDLHPRDRIEWTPFLQAYAMKGDVEGFETVASRIERLPFVRTEACKALLGMQERGSAFTTGIQSLIDGNVCRSQPV